MAALDPLRVACSTCGARPGEPCTRMVRSARAGDETVYYELREGPPLEPPRVHLGRRLTAQAKAGQAR